MLSEACLIGAWQLISNLDLDADGIASEGPLGPHPKGLLMYGERGHMSVSMMRTERLNDAGPGPVRHPLFYMGYSGTWRLVNNMIVHEVEVSSHLHMVNTKQIRKAVLSDDRLTLYATARIGRRLTRRVLSWQRA